MQINGVSLGNSPGVPLGSPLAGVSLLSGNFKGMSGTGQPLSFPTQKYLLTWPGVHAGDQALLGSRGGMKIGACPEGEAGDEKDPHLYRQWVPM